LARVAAFERGNAMLIKSAVIGGAFASLFFLVGSGAAQATIYSGMFTGIVTDGLDQNNIFGLGSTANLAGLAVTGDFYYNTGAPGAIVVGDELGASGPTYPYIIYAEVYVGGSANPVGTSSDDQGDVSFTNNNVFRLQGDDYDYGNSDSVSLTIGSGGPAFGGSGLGQSFTLTNPPIGGGTFYDDAGFDPYTTLTQGDFTITSAQLNDAPEPASATLLIAGLTGVLFWRRRGGRVSLAHSFQG
jgi:hypothetical protein